MKRGDGVCRKIMSASKKVELTCNFIKEVLSITGQNLSSLEFDKVEISVHDLDNPP